MNGRQHISKQFMTLFKFNVYFIFSMSWTQWILLVTTFSTLRARPCPQNTFYLIGSFRPQCDGNGGWLPKQCHGSTGLCWCVDSEGEPTSESVHGPLDCPLLRPSLPTI